MLIETIYLKDSCTLFLQQSSEGIHVLDQQRKSVVAAIKNEPVLREPNLPRGISGERVEGHRQTNGGRIPEFSRYAFEALP
jgi:hypothetical protein